MSRHVSLRVVFGTASELSSELLEAIFRYRYRVFVEVMGWKLDTPTERELDEFDGPDAVHIAVLDEQQSLVGYARLLPTLGPYLLERVFADLLDGAAAPRSLDTWEISRFASMDLRDDEKRTLSEGSLEVLIEACLSCAESMGAQSLVSVTPVPLQRKLRGMGVSMRRVGRPRIIDTGSTAACCIDVAATRLARNAREVAKSQQ